MKSWIPWCRGINGASKYINERRVRQVWKPRVDLEVTKSSVIVTADLPGVDPKELEVTLQNGNLVLRGNKKGRPGSNADDLARNERYSGPFEREIPLPPDIDPNDIKAESAQGVVTITIAKKESKVQKSISVSVK